MQGIESTKHQNRVKTIRQFEELSTMVGHIIPEEHDAIMRKNAAELKGTYDYYLILIKELEGCIHSYNELHESLQRMMYPYIRKMNAKVSKKERFIK